LIAKAYESGRDEERHRYEEFRRERAQQERYIRPGGVSEPPQDLDAGDAEDMRTDGKCAGFEETYGDSALCKCGHTFHVHDEETDMCRICPRRTASPAA
jgi:hypothetical protein